MPEEQSTELTADGELPDYTDSYNTELTPAEKEEFNKWLEGQSKKDKKDRSRDLYDYDMQGFWKSGDTQGENGHFPDTFKKPNHPTFSNQSKYNGAFLPNGTKAKGGTWQDDEYTPPENPNDFRPTKTKASMSLFDLFNANAQQTGAASEGSGYPSIGDIQADYVNVDNLVNNRAKSADWGAATGAGVGAFFGKPQEGANVGRVAFPILEQAGKKAWGFFNK